MTHVRTYITLDALGGGDITLSVARGDSSTKERRHVITGMPKRQARALANRILHEIEYAEGRRARRPSSPFLFFDDLQPCMDCGRKNATPCEGRGGRACPLATIEVPK